MKYMIALLGLFVWMAPVASADYHVGSQTLTLFGGSGSTGTRWKSQSPDDDSSWIADPGNAIGGQYLYFICAKPAIAIGVDGQQVNLKDHTSDILYTNVHTTSRFDGSIMLAIAKLAFPTGRWRPYIFGGLGMHHSSLSLSGTPFGAAWPASGQLVNDSSSGLAMGGGVGIDFFAMEALFIGLEYRQNLLLHVSDRLTPEAQAAGFRSNDGDHSTVGIGNLLIRLGVKFGA